LDGDSARGRFPAAVDLPLDTFDADVFEVDVRLEAFVLVCLALPFVLGAEDGPALAAVRLGGLKGRRGRFCAG
jgi:hypothetical protein